MKKFIISVFLLLASLTMFGETWKETKVIDVPTTAKVEQGTTKTGKTKYFIVIGDGDKTKQVTVSENNVKHLQKHDNSIVLVIWQSETGKQRFSTRLKNAAKKETSVFNIKKISVK
jgi:hypothetical protein